MTLLLDCIHASGVKASKWIPFFSGISNLEKPICPLSRDEPYAHCSSVYIVNINIILTCYSHHRKKNRKTKSNSPLIKFSTLSNSSGLMKQIFWESLEMLKRVNMLFIFFFFLYVKCWVGGIYLIQEVLNLVKNTLIKVKYYQ